MRLALLLTLLLASGVNAQPDTLWTRVIHYPYDVDQFAVQVLNTSDGGAVVAGNIAIFGMSYRFSRLAADGDLLWANGYGTGNGAWCTCVAPAPAGGFVMGGYMAPSHHGPLQAYLIRTDDNGGEIMWRVRRIGGLPTGEVARALLPLDDGTFLIAGDFTDSTEQALPDAYLVQMSDQGDTLWTRAYAQPTSENVTSICMLADGNLLLAGYGRPYYTGTYFYFMKLTPGGDTLWTRSYGAGDYDLVCKVFPTADGGAIFGGTTTAFDVAGDLCLGKISGDGDSLWVRPFGGGDEEQAYDLATTTDGGYLLCGESKSWDGSGDAYLIRTDGDGNLQWSYRYGEIGTYEMAKTVIQTADGGVLLAGDFSGEQCADVFVVRLAEERSAAGGPAVPLLNALVRSFPNPFNASTEIMFELSHRAQVSLTVFDLTGREVATLVDGVLDAGSHARVFDGRSLASGLYFYRLRAGAEYRTGKLVLLK